MNVLKFHIYSRHNNAGDVHPIMHIFGSICVEKYDLSKDTIFHFL